MSFVPNNLIPYAFSPVFIAEGEISEEAHGAHATRYAHLFDALRYSIGHI